MAKDLVCGMEVNEQGAAATSKYQERTYYFCSQACKEKFDAEPEKYIGEERKKDTCCE
ncbi:MAG: YHS domain-containing protein [Candidatus Aminicenantia bacterium]